MEKETDIRERLERIISDNLERMETDIQELEPKDRIKVLLEIARFVLPTLKSIDNNVKTHVEQPLFDIRDIYKQNIS